MKRFGFHGIHLRDTVLSCLATARRSMTMSHVGTNVPEHEWVSKQLHLTELDAM